MVKHTQTNCLSVSDHFVGLKPEELKLKQECTSIFVNFPLYECKHFVKTFNHISHIVAELNFVPAVKNVC